MCRKLACFATIVVLIGLLSPLAVAHELSRYDFDGLEDLDGDFNKDGRADGADFLDCISEPKISSITSALSYRSPTTELR
jgi:hypothetical protein